MFDGMQLNSSGLPVNQGLYNPENEKDACGVGFVVNIDGHATRKVMELVKPPGSLCEKDKWLSLQHPVLVFFCSFAYGRIAPRFYAQTCKMVAVSSCMFL